MSMHRANKRFRKRSLLNKSNQPSRYTLGLHLSSLALKSACKRKAYGYLPNPLLQQIANRTKDSRSATHQARTSAQSLAGQLKGVNQDPPKVGRGKKQTTPQA